MKKRQERESRMRGVPVPEIKGTSPATKATSLMSTFEVTEDGNGYRFRVSILAKIGARKEGHTTFQHPGGIRAHAEGLLAMAEELENHVYPLFQEHGIAAIPQEWLDKQKEASNGQA